jgi:hypothetical protein
MRRASSTAMESERKRGEPKNKKEKHNNERIISGPSLPKAFFQTSASLMSSGTTKK